MYLYFLATFKKKILLNDSGEKKPRMKLLLIHPGFSSYRHQKNYEVIILSLSKYFQIELHSIICSANISACGFISNVNANLNDNLNIANRNCFLCNNKLVLNSSFKNINWVNTKKFINKKDWIYINKQLTNVHKIKNVQDLIGLKYFKTVIGDRIWESVQRYAFSGSPIDLKKIEPCSVIYEFIKTGLFYSAVAKNFFESNSFDLILTNEVSYIEWGILSRFAIMHKIPILHQSHFYNGEKKLCLALKTSEAELGNLPHLPKPDYLKKILTNAKKVNFYLDIQKTALNKIDSYYSKLAFVHGSKVLSRNSLEALSVINNSSNPNVIIFIHLCWDASLSFSSPIFSTMEDWISFTFKIAENNKDVNWIFKIHPNELEVNFINKNNNSLTFMQELLDKSDASNIYLIDSLVNLKQKEIIPKLHAVISVTGTVAIEYPSLKVPCILASKKGYGDFGFSINTKSIIDYENLLNNIKVIKKVSKKNVHNARVLLGYLFDDSSYFDVSNVNYSGTNLNSNELFNTAFSFNNLNYLDLVFNQKINNFENNPLFLKNVKNAKFSV